MLCRGHSFKWVVGKALMASVSRDARIADCVIAGNIWIFYASRVEVRALARDLE
jgi:hypothetical protein